jgi:hypothetical protein
LHVGNVNKCLFVDDATSAITLRIGLLMALHHACAFDLDLALGRRNFQYATALALVATCNDHHLIILSNLGAFDSRHSSNNLRRK